MADSSLRKVTIVGLGLIGGSLSRRLRADGFAEELVGYDKSPEILELGADLGVIDSFDSDLDRALAGSDLVVIAVPTLAAAEIIETVVKKCPESAVITDVASVKGPLAAAYENARERLETGADGIPRKAAPFVPGHPIAGSERSGVQASRPDLFEDHRVILTPLEGTDSDAVSLVTRMWEQTGAEVVELDVDDHDAILAATSHLPHVLAYALVDALSRSDVSEDIFRFAAGGFRDFTRIASSDPVMWRDIALANREPLLVAIDSFAAHLAELRDAVDRGDAVALENTFAHAREARESFIKKNVS